MSRNPNQDHNINALHELRIEAVLSIIRAGGAESVLDLGCGSGILLKYLASEGQIKKIVGIDTCTASLAQARELLSAELAEPNKRVQIAHGSFLKFDETLASFDAAVMLETIEHILPQDLSRLESVLFLSYRPKLVVITTPNCEYNKVYGMNSDQLRRSDHCFEWSREKFKLWSDGVGKRAGYSAKVKGIGSPHTNYGPPTQLAEFRRLAP